MRRIEDMGIAELLGIIRREPKGERRERALAAALSSLVEVEIEWRFDLRHQNAGYHNVSTIGSMGEGRSEMAGAVDHVGEAAERYRYECRWRSMAKALLAHVNERQRLGWPVNAGYRAQASVSFMTTRWPLAPIAFSRWKQLQRLRQVQEPSDRVVFRTMLPFS